jgi:hypothetical protein
MLAGFRDANYQRKIPLVYLKQSTGFQEMVLSDWTISARDDSKFSQ